MDELKLIWMFKRLSTTEQIHLNDRLKEVIARSQASEDKQFPLPDPPLTIP